MIPALAIKPSIRIFNAFTDSTAARTELGSESSHATGIPLSAEIEARAVFAFSSVRARPMIVAPRAVKARAVSSPKPELTPVTKNTLSESSTP